MLDLENAIRKIFQKNKIPDITTSWVTLEVGMNLMMAMVAEQGVERAVQSQRYVQDLVEKKQKEMQEKINTLLNNE